MGIKVKKDDKVLPLPSYELPEIAVHTRILQFVHELYNEQVDVSIEIIDDRFMIKGSMKPKEKTE